MRWVGIDEAGLGPLLGPMVTTAVTLDVPSEHVQSNLWEVLASAIARKPSAKEARLAITDSKKLSSRADGLAWLERGALALLMQLPSVSENNAAHTSDTHTWPWPYCEDLLKLLCSHAAPQLAACPWYGSQISLPVAADQAGLVLRSHKLTQALSTANISVKTVQSEVLFESAFNAWIDKLKNKSALCWQNIARLIHAAIIAGADRIDVDRQGGRQFYLDQLMEIQEGDWQICTENETESIYRCLIKPISSGTRSTSAPMPAREVQISFVVEADQKSLLVAWASVISKYCREVFMTRMNRYVAAHQPNIRPTKGYWPDGQRFVREATQTLEQLGIVPTNMFRQR